MGVPPRVRNTIPEEKWGTTRSLLVNGSTDTTSPNEADEEPFAESVDGQGDEDSITMDAGRPQRKRKRTSILFQNNFSI